MTANETIRVTNLEVGTCMFWTLTDDSGSRRMRTNESFTGCYEQVAETQWKQILGTSQFNLNGRSLASVRSYIRKKFSN